MYENVGKAQPVWVFASCEITPYDQAIDDIGRNALFAPEGPAVAVVCAARSVFANYNRSLNMGFMEFALGKDAAGNRHSLGEALRLTKCELINNTGLPIGTDQTINKLKYILMGDPALCLSYPDPGIRIDSINGEAIKGTGMTELRIGQNVRLTGYVNADAMATTPDTSYDGTLSGTVFAPLNGLPARDKTTREANDSALRTTPKRSLRVRSKSRLDALPWNSSFRAALLSNKRKDCSLYTQ